MLARRRDGEPGRHGDLKEANKQIVACALELSQEGEEFVKSQTPPSASAGSAK